MSETIVYAGFWRRFTAYGVDAHVIVLISFILSLFLGNAFAQSPEDIQALVDTGLLQPGTTPQDLVKQLMAGNGEGGSLFSFSDFALPVLISAVYNILFVAGDWQATPGKRWCKIKVVTIDSARLSLAESALRHLCSGPSKWLFGLGYVPMFFNKQKTAWHDMVCNTRVIRTTVAQ